MVRAMCILSMGGEPWDKKLFKGEDDVDIGVFYDECEEHYIKNFWQTHGLVLSHKIVDNITGKPLYYSIKASPDLKEMMGDLHICIFWWYKWDGYYWHTYDYDGHRPKTGIPSRYVLKGIPAETLEGELVHVENIANSMHGFKIPPQYGRLLDLWYPPSKDHPLGWLKPKQCVSDAPRIIECKSMHHLESGKFKKLKWTDTV